MKDRGARPAAKRGQPKSGRVHSTARWRLPAAGVALIVLALCIAYYPSLHGWFVYDDDLLITANPLVKAPDGLYRFWFTDESIDYWPVVNTTFWVEWRLWATDPTGYHVTNLLLHIGDTLLIWAILRRLRIPGAFLAALLFGVHPVNVESVAWISQRKNLLAMLFALLSVLCFLQGDAASEAAPAAARVPPVFGRWDWLSLAAFTLAMLSKTSAAFVPLVLLGITLWRGAVTRRDLLRTLPFVVVAAALVRLTVWFRPHGGDAPVATATPIERVLGAGSVVWFYLSRAMLPVNLAFLYPQWQVDVHQWRYWLASLGVIAFTGLLWWYRDGWGRAGMFAWGYYCLALLPVLGFIDVGYMQHLPVADHYQHFALIGVTGVAAAGWSVWQRTARGGTRRVAGVIAAAAVTALMVLTWKQSRLYADPISLYEASLQQNPDSWVAHNNLGAALVDTGRLTDAIDHYRTALRLHPDYAAAQYNWGNALLRSGRIDDAREHYEEALRLQPDYPEAEHNLGVTFTQTGQIEQAIAHYEQAVRLKPNYPDAQNNLGSALLQAGKLQEAIEHFEQAVQLKPDFPSAQYNLGLALAQADRPQEAVAHFREALRLKPDYPEAQNNLGSALLQTGHAEEAIGHFGQALRLKPNFTFAEYNMGMALAQEGRLQEAIVHYQQALRLQPDYAEAHNNLGILMAKTGRDQEAVRHYQEALRLKPDYAEAQNNLSAVLASKPPTSAPVN